MRAFSQNMNVVGHQAIRMQREKVGCSALKEEIKDAFGGRWVVEKTRTVITTNGDEIRLATDIVLWR